MDPLESERCEANDASSLSHNPVAQGVGGKGAFRALTRGYTHWASGRLNKLEVNTCNQTLCFVCCQMRPSMKTGFYTIKLILRKSDNNVAVIAQAICQCAAG